MHKLGFVSAILGDSTFEEVVDFASANNFSCVEMMCWPKGKAERRYAGITHVDVDDLDENRVNYLKDYLKKKNVAISGLGYYPNPLDPDPQKSEAYIEHIKKVIKAANTLGVGVANTFIGRDHTKSIEENLRLYQDIWPSIVRVAEEQNVRIGIENCPMYFTNDEWPGGKNLAISPAIWDKMFELIPSRALGLNYDPSHLVWMHMDHVQPIYTYKDRLYHIHLKDVKIYKEKLDRVGIMANPLEYHSPKIPGLGDVRWRDFFSALTTVKYRGPVCIEVEDKSFEGSKEDIESSILISRNFLSQFLVL
jgi:sugar phosphate isomerase/epimerase